MSARISFSDRLLAWWDIHGRKDLPWQHPRSVYRVWVSEIMLQQTQVVTVIPYFQRFIERFPDLESLASASQDDVLALWAGLGYYARGRNLHKAAVIVMQEHGGVLPVTAEQLAALPGIGESTANAIVSQALGIPAVVVDGNVRRVLARHDMIDGWVGKPAVQKVFWQAAKDRLPEQRGADYSQAIMDLGATLCTRSNPRCPDCPVKEDCLAYRSESVSEFPARRPRLKISEKQMHMLIMASTDGQVLLEKRPPVGIWGGLWSLPEEEDERLLANRFGCKAEEFSTLPDMEHRLTHMRIRIKPRIANSNARADSIKCRADQRWFKAGEWSAAGLPKPVLSLLTQHQREYEHDTHG
jgi:A/G-specific adenine glycosylase